MPFVHTGIVKLAVILVATVYAFPQDGSGQAAPGPNIVIHVPDNVSSEAMWIRYVRRGPGNTGGSMDFVRVRADVHEYVIPATYAGRPAEEVKIVVYAPGCEFKTYEIAPAGAADIAKNFDCVPLPTKTVHGYLAPEEIPSPIFKGQKKLNIVAELEDDWVCGYLMERRQGDAIMIAGSCLGLPVRLGQVGEIDPAEKGHFEIKIPDFTRDPLFSRYGSQPRGFGVQALVLREKVIDRPLCMIRPKSNAPEIRGLTIQSEYAELVVFTTAR
jgi:hypothetical protein